MMRIILISKRMIAKDDNMAKKRFWLAMVLLFGMLFVGNLSAQTDNRLNGTWFTFIDKDELKYIFRNGIFEISGRMNSNSENVIVVFRGTYTTSGSEITTSITHVNGELFGGGILGSGLYTKEGLIGSPIGMFIGILITEEQLNEIYATETIEYTVNGNTLTMTGANIFTMTQSIGDTRTLSRE